MSIGESVHGGKSEDVNNPASIALGIVKENWDAAHPGMVKVNILVEGGKESESDWMPVAVPYAANNCGLYLLPEVGSTVIIGYIDDNSVTPVVIGSVWNKTGKGTTEPPKETANQQNSVKVFCTSKGHMIKFDESDDKQCLEIMSAKKMKITFDDVNEKIIMSDGSNEVELDNKNQAVTLKAAKEFKLKIGDSAECIKADSSGVTIKAKECTLECDVLNLKGKQTKVDGASVEVKASGNLNLQASGMAAVKGSMLKLN